MIIRFQNLELIHENVAEVQTGHLSVCMLTAFPDGLILYLSNATGKYLLDPIKCQRQLLPRFPP